MCLYVTALPSTCWLLVTSKSILRVSPSLSQETAFLGTDIFSLLTTIPT